MPMKAQMALKINRMVRLPTLTRLEVKHPGSPTSLMTTTISGACRIRLASTSLSLRMSRKLRWMSTPSCRRNFMNFTGCIVSPPPVLRPGRPPQGG